MPVEGSRIDLHPSIGDTRGRGAKCGQVQSPAVIDSKRAKRRLEPAHDAAVCPGAARSVGMPDRTFPLAVVPADPDDVERTHQGMIQLAAQSVIMRTGRAAARQEIGRRGQTRARQRIHEPAGRARSRKPGAGIYDLDALSCADKLKRQQGACKATADDECVDAAGHQAHQPLPGGAGRSAALRAG